MNNKKRNNKSRLWQFLYVLLRDVYPNTVEKPFISERHLLYMLFVLLVYLFFLYATAEWTLPILWKAIKDLRDLLRIMCYPRYNEIKLLVIFLLVCIALDYYPYVFTSTAIYEWIAYLKKLFLAGLYLISGLD